MSEAHYRHGVVVDEGRPAGGRTLRFTGGRFSAERLTDEAFAAVGKSLLAFREAVVELAKQDIEGDDERSAVDIPSTISEFHFCVADMRPGSLEIDVRPDGETEMFEVEDPCIRSADRIETAIAELGREGEGDVLASLPERMMGLIANIGAPLKGSEAVAFASRRGVARLGLIECERLRRPRSNSGIVLELVAGRVLRISADQSRASLSVLGWRAPRTTSIYYERLATIDQMRVALTSSEETGPLVTAAGPFRWSAGKLEIQNSASSLEEVIIHDEAAAERMDTLVSEIDELEELVDGWYDTDGVAGHAPHPEAILGARRLAAVFTHYGLPYPHVFPSVEGGVSMEWSLGDIEASITFDDSSDTATVASLDVSTDVHSYEERVDVDCGFVRDWLRGFTGQPAR